MATRLAMNDGTNEIVRKLKFPMMALSRIINIDDTHREYFLSDKIIKINDIFFYLRKQRDKEYPKALAVKKAVDCKIPRKVFFSF